MNNIEKIIKEINKKFNTSSISYSYYSEEDSYFILLSNKDLFESDKFQEYIFVKKAELWNKGIVNIHFDYEEQTITSHNYDYATSSLFSQVIEAPIGCLMPQRTGIIPTYSFGVPFSGQLSAVAADNYDYALAA
jgi:hypothetical protein